MTLSPNEVLVISTQLCMGFALSATCGLRAFLPLFVAGLLSRVEPGWVTMGPSFAWMGSTPSLIVFGSAVIFELVGDKFPAVDHALDAAGLVVKPVAGTLLAASFFTQLDPLPATVLGLVSGGVAAGGIQLVKTKARLASTFLTAGFGNPVLSVIEDVIAVVSVAMAILVPLFAAFTIFGLFLMVVAVVLIHRSNRRSRADAPITGRVVAV